MPTAAHRRRLDSIADVLDRAASSGERVDAELVGAEGGFAGLVLAALQTRLERTLVVVAPDEVRARDLRLAIDFFEPSSALLEPVAGFWPLDHSPFSGMSPSRALVMERVGTIFRLVHGLGVRVLVVPAPALLDRVPPRSVLEEQAWLVIAGDTLDRDGLLQFLANTGYHAVPQVEDPGTFAVRGGIVDVFSAMFELPLRIDLWGDEVESIRFFDPSSQRTVDGGKVGEIVLGPARAILFSDDARRRARSALLDLADELTVPTTRARAVVDDVEAGVLAVGMEELLPAFYRRLDSLFDIAGHDTVWLIDQPERVHEALLTRWHDLVRRSERRRAEEGALCYRAEALHLPADEAWEALSKRAVGRLVPFAMVDRPATVSKRFATETNADLRQAIAEASHEGDSEVLAPLTRRVREWRQEGLAVVACAHSSGGAERLKGLLAHYGLRTEHRTDPFHIGLIEEAAGAPAEVMIFEGDPGQGFRSRELGLVLIDETEILGKKQHRRRRRHAQVAPEDAIESWQDLQEGDLVVHLMHGIGRYLGLTKSHVGSVEVDFLAIMYAENNKLFVPVDKLHLVSRHSGAEASTAAKLDKLGGVGWLRTKKRVTKAVRNIADKLLRLYAEREAREGVAISPPGELFARFEADFPWEETPDQQRAIERILADQQRARPMDRLVCGDVGFGKTEVAMRAAALAVLDGKQVAVLVPTVVLAEQHRLSFQRRFEDLPVVVESMTRSGTAKEIRLLRDRIARGQVDIVIGTHKLLSKSLEFRDLGLLIIDEEHRFGVAHKERLKATRPDVDVLALTATPIPRTLNLSLVGLRDISLIQTPPIDRLSVHTMVAQPTELVIREAIEQELARGGQVFYIHNRVRSIYKHAELLRRLVPEARIVVGHGQMDAGELEQVMLKFVHGEANVLVSTTIVESGLDIPRANTILIDRADRFGLAQLYQLRGRVGRSSVRAFCYLLIPSPKNLAGDAAKRIAALQRFTELGSGYHVASHDLDIRGAGDLLGADQAGNIDAVGYDAYMSLLRDAVEQLKHERGEGDAPGLDPELKIVIEGRIPEAWLPETALRLRLYKHLAGARTVDELYTVFRDAVDRFGKAPASVHNLVAMMAIKLEAIQLGFSYVGYNSAAISYGLTNMGPFGGSLLAGLLGRPHNRYKLAKGHRLTRPVKPDEWERGIETLRDDLRELARYARMDRLR